MGSLGSHFESLTNPRHARNRQHLLVDLVVISICGILCGASGPTAIHRWAKSKHEWLAKDLGVTKVFGKLKSFGSSGNPGRSSKPTWKEPIGPQNQLFLCELKS